jgi:hypothetical protein
MNSSSSLLLELDHYTDESNAWTIFGYALTTHRVAGVIDGSIEFPYQQVAAAIALAFFRTTVYSPKEPWVIRCVFSVLLVLLMLGRKSYELIIAVEIFSYSFAILAAFQADKLLWWKRLLYGVAGLFGAATLSYGVAHALVTG